MNRAHVFSFSVRFHAVAGAICLLLALALLAGCERLKTPPRPGEVPAGATYDRKKDTWSVQSPNEFREYYSSGLLAIKGPVRNGVRTGQWTWFAPDGTTVTTEGVYREGRRDGLWKHYDNSGRLYLTIQYAPEPSDPIISALSIDFGNENGPYRRYYPDGNLEEEGNYRAGKNRGQ